MILCKDPRTSSNELTKKGILSAECSSAEMLWSAPRKLEHGSFSLWINLSDLVTVEINGCVDAVRNNLSIGAFEIATIRDC